MENTDKTKCNCCRCWKPNQDFINKDKVVKSCEKCRKLQALSREKNKEKIKEKIKKYYEENKEQLKEYKKGYYEKNKENNKDKIKEYRENNKDKIKEYRENNKEQMKEQMKEWRENQKQENPLKVKINAMIRTSKANDTKYNRTYEDIDYVDYDFLNDLWVSQEGKCGYESCKCDLVLTFNHDTRNPNQVSIQRINNKIAHIKTNVILSCFFCNVMKHMENEL